ncbi:MAG: hypothetical protein WKG03_13630 [Telluria sp.]
MRTAFEAWAQRDGHIVRRREDKPDEYLVFETQRRWVIWQAALAHGKTAAATTKYAAPKIGAKEASPESVRAAAPATSDESAVRNRVLNEVLDAFSDLDDTAGIEGVLKVIQGLKKKQKAMAEDKSES